ncbi:hypothetical protein OAH85_09025 [Paracoccaceae bacterium]|nr:hypothetical protein [Paracoccaceae bacterium]MBT4229764.1 hypothetical protein [Paracoccaceae bacterium]MBT5317118.1 hypothetical protein [Paracoccaceae bacterium]MBT5854890.1 hypothetical protein [Paracoccaceae bacterium]MBT7414381.1 hypothetical protein [Paracoccaceae bacterium]
MATNSTVNYPLILTAIDCYTRHASCATPALSSGTSPMRGQMAQTMMTGPSDGLIK